MDKKWCYCTAGVENNERKWRKSAICILQKIPEVLQELIHTGISNCSICKWTKMY